MTVSTETPSTKAAEPANLGAVFTRRWVADLVLDLAGYSADEPLHRLTAVEPACGPGAFVAAMAERLVESCARHGVDIADTGNSIIAVDIDHAAVSTSKAMVIRTLRLAGVAEDTAYHLADTWIRQGDFLMIAPHLPKADWVVGNPPYVRIEDVSPNLMAAYRERWQTMTGRADVYVGFFEAGLGLLREGGRLSYICADRWMRNQYGARLRTLVEGSFSVDACVVLHDVDAFEDRVAAYPAITVIRNGEQGSALVADADADFDARAAEKLTRAWTSGPGSTSTVDDPFQMSWLREWFNDQGSWPATTPRNIALLTELESRFPVLADAGVRVAVGVATGADDAYLTPDPRQVESDRLLRIITARELSTGTIVWKGRWLINPWDENDLVDLDAYPRLKRYLKARKPRIQARHVAKANPTRWWRTLDRVHPSIASTRKLLIPDLKDRIFPVLDDGTYYPAHSLYYITSDEWDLEELGGLLMSDIANLFVAAYSVRMASGYMRVSAQYLRRVRIPRRADVPEDLRKRLAVAFRNRDQDAANQLAHKAYAIDCLDVRDTRP